MGANLGDTLRTLRSTVAGLAVLPGTTLLRVSSLWRSAPVDAVGPDYLNVVASLATTLGPHALLERLQALEHAAGRERPWRHAPRTLDLDLLRHGDAVCCDAVLTLPHPRMFERAFVLLPLAEITSGIVSQAALNAVRSQRIERLPATWLS